VKAFLALLLKAVVDGAVSGGKNGVIGCEILGDHINIQTAFVLGIIIGFSEFIGFSDDILLRHYAFSSFAQRK
jgi:hypothetical protein